MRCTACDGQRRNEERVRRHRQMNKQRVITMLSACRFALLTRHKHGHEPEYFSIICISIYSTHTYNNVYITITIMSTVRDKKKYPIKSEGG